jgi:N-acetylglucosamine transport system substrate-binding protein
MKTAHALFACASVFALIGCGPSDSSSGKTDASAKPDSGATADSGTASKEAPVPAGKVTGNLVVRAFKGGYGIDFYQQVGTEFAAANPGLKVDVDGKPDIADELRQAVLGGTPPDLMYPGWKLDHWALADDGQLFTLDKALDSPAYDGKGTWRDTFVPTILKLGQKDGKQYVLPYFFNVWGWWYNPDIFAKHGWTPPKSFDELMTLCDKIKAAGIAPMTFQGKYPYYMLNSMVMPWVQDEGGIQAVNDLQNLTPGAWKSAPVLDAIKKLRQMKDKGYFQSGATGLNHTDSQMQFLLGNAAMIPCGTWLDSEMKKVAPAGSKMAFFQPPFITGGKGDPSAVIIDIEPWMIPSGAKNPEAGVAYYKYMTSLPVAKRFVEQKGTLTAIKGSETAKLPETLVEPAKAFSASKTVFSYVARQWYAKMETNIENALTSMLNGEITPEQFCDRAEAEAQKVRDDSSITKHKVG